MKQNTVSAIPAFNDNYIWCIHNNKHAVIVDPGDAEPVLAFLKSQQLELVGLLITHHHYDHVDGIPALKQAYPNLLVYGPNNPKISGITHTLKEGDSVSFESPLLSCDVLETPGHTLDHIVYYNDTALFCGDTLFSAGCGRMFEGSPEVFYESLMKLSKLPESLKVYCAHEYTKANVAFAQHVEPSNAQLEEYAAWVSATRKQNNITLPSTIKQEHEINPFLRCHTPAIQTQMDIQSDNPKQAAIASFAALRKLKDHF